MPSSIPGRNRCQVKGVQVSVDEDGVDFARMSRNKVGRKTMRDIESREALKSEGGSDTGNWKRSLVQIGKVAPMIGTRQSMSRGLMVDD